MKKTDQKTQMIVQVGVLAALGTAMFMFLPEIPLLGNHLKLDISDLPAMIAAMMINPLAGLLVEIIKNVVHLTKTTTFGIGELMNVLVGGAMVYSISGFYRLGKRIRKSERKLDHGAYLFSVACTTVVTIAVGYLVNLILTGPYLKILNADVSFGIIQGFASAATVLNLSKALLNGMIIYPVLVALKNHIRSSGKI